MSELNLLDYILGDFVEFYDKIQNLFPVCLKCQKPIFLKNIKENKIVKMKIDCPFCNNSETLTLDEYIKKLESLITEKKTAILIKVNYLMVFAKIAIYGYVKNVLLSIYPKIIFYINPNLKFVQLVLNTQMKKQVFIIYKKIYIYVINAILNLY